MEWWFLSIPWSETSDPHSGLYWTFTPRRGEPCGGLPPDRSRSPWRALPWAFFRGRHLPRFTARTLRPRPPRSRTPTWRSVSQKLDSGINKRYDAGQIAEAVLPAREKLDLLAPTLGKDHWQTGRRHRNLETYHRLQPRPAP